MRKNFQKVLCSLLTILMIVGMFPVSAFADAPFEGNHEGSVVVSVKDAVTGSGLSGVSVKLEDITAGRYMNYGTKTTDTQGRASWGDLSSGWYRVTQIAVPDGYILDNTPKVEYIDTEQQDTLSFEFSNRSENALYIYRIDPATQQGLAGASYLVQSSTGAEVAKGMTDERGYLIIPHLPAGDYTITEVKAPNGYTPSKPQTIHIVESSDDPFVAIFTGAEKSSITIFNYDGATGEPIAGSTWRITKANGGTVADHLKTNQNGMVTVSELEPGTYIITQTAVAPGYIKELKHTEVTLGQKSENKVVSLSNIRPGTITVHVADSVTGKDLAGCSFSLYNERNQVVSGPYSSNNQGIVTFEEVDDGHYTVVGTPASGYILDVTSQAVQMENGGDKVVQFTATPLGSLLIKAVDEAEPTKMLPGAEFEVRDMKGKLIGNFTTGTDGAVQVPHLDNGYYVIQETVAPNGYVMESTTKTVYVEAGAVTPVVFSHRDKPYITVHTYIKGTTTPIAGSVINLVNENNAVVMTGTTGSDGSYAFEDLNPGTYTVKYASAPEGYTIDTPTQTVVVTKSTSGEATLYASRHSSIIIQKLDDKTQEPLANATFLIRDAQGTPVENVTTDATGTAVSKVLTPGRYTIQEMYAPEGYVPVTTSRAVEVKNNIATLATFTNQQKSAIVVYAYDNDGIPLANISYILYNSITGKEVASALTNEAGVATFEKVEPGIYMVTESVVPEGLVVIEQSQSRIVVSPDKPSYVRFVHIPQSTIKMETVDIETGEPVIGAVYQVVKDDGTFKANYTTDGNGEAFTEKLPLGTYYVKQIQAPEGYLLNTTTQTITVLKDRVNLAKFFNKPISRIVVECVVSGENFGLGGATITVENEAGKEVSRGTTLDDGLFTTGELEPGHYTVKVISTPDGYTCIQKQRTVEVTYDNPTTVKFEFTANNRIIVNLTDASDSTKGLANSKFRVEKVDSDFVTEIVTDEQGKAVTEALEDGKYMVSQVTAPEGYILDRSYQWATVDSTANTVLDFTNHRISGLVIQALTEDDHKPLAGATFEVWEQNGKLIKTVTTDKTGVVTLDKLESGIYLVKEVKVPDGYTARTLTQTVTVSVDTPTTLDFYHTQKSALTINKTDAKTHQPLAGAVYKISTIEGVKVGEYTTDAAGQIVVDALDAGTYNIVEVKAPDGYVLDSAARTFTIKDNEPLTLDFTNHRISGLAINTLTEKDHKPLAGATYEIWEVNGKLVKTVTSDSTGLNLIDKLQPGKYLVKEVKVPDGYTARTLTQTITITTDEPSVLYFYHTTESSLTINKTDARTGKPVAGAEYRITKSNGDFVGDYTTDSSGKIVIDSLPAGTYNIAETKAPDGYILDTTSKSFTIKDDQPLVLDLTNEPESGFRLINTCTQDGKPIAGNSFKITTYDGKLVGNYTTNSAGLINVQLDPGTYTIYQTYVKKGYVRNTEVWNVTIKAGENKTLEVQNDREARIVVHFVDAQTDERIYAVEMEIKDKNNNFVGRFKSNNEGDVDLTEVLNEGKYILNILTVPSGYEKDSVPKTITVEPGKTTEITWKLHRHQGQVTIVTYSGEDNAMMNIRKNSKLSGAVYQITDTTGRVVGTIKGDVNGNAYSGSLNIGTYYVQQIVAPTGWQVNATRFAVTVTNVNDNIRVEVYNKAANYQTTVSVHGQATAMAGAQVKYYFNLSNASTSAMDNFTLHIKVPTDAMRASTFYTGTYTGAATTYRLEIKTNMSDYRTLASGLNSKSNYSYDLSTQSLNLQSGEYVTDVRMVFNSAVSGFRDSMAPSMYCYVLSTVRTGHNAIMRAEVGAMNGYYSNNSNGGIYGTNTGQSHVANPSVSIDNGWVTSAGQFSTYIYGYYQNILPGQLPKTGY